MKSALLIAAKDLRQRVRNRSAILTSVVAPLGLAVIFSLLIGPNAEFHASYVVADLDGGELATAFRQEFVGALAAQGVADVEDVNTEDEARAAVDGGASAAFIIPTGFTRAIQSGQRTTLEIIGSNESAIGREVAHALARAFADRVATAELAIATVASLEGALPDQAASSDIASAAAQAGPPVELVDVQASLRQLDLSAYFSASMAILFLFFSAQIGLVSLFDERYQGTLRRMLAGPIRPGTILAGKLLGAFGQSVVAMTVLVVATTLLIGASWGPPLGVAALVLAAIIAALGITTLVTTFMHSAQSAGAANSAVAITLGILGGTFAPTSQGPEALSVLALLTPHGWFLQGLGDLHPAGASLTDALPSIGVLLAIGLLTGAIGLRRAGRLVAA